MKIYNTDFAEFAQVMKEKDKQVIIWGTGTFFQTCIPWLLENYDLVDRVCCLIDKDKKKCGQKVNIFGKVFKIESPAAIVQWKDKDCQLLITSSYFAGIVDWVEESGCNLFDCYIAPLMFLPQKGDGFQKYQCKVQQIPKVIHYCWFGRNPIPEKNMRCIESWKKWCPDYEIIQWNEDNYDLKRNRYMLQAYEQGKYGYVPDYIRIDLLYQYGGIYFDTDVELVRNIDDLLYLKGFTSFEEYPMINFGGGSGSMKGLEILKEILDFREKYDFIDSNGEQNLLTCGFYETVPLLKKGLRVANDIQNIGDLTVLTSEYFHVKSGITKEICQKECTFGIHDFSWSWVSETQKEEQKRTGELVKRYFNNE